MSSLLLLLVLRLKNRVWRSLRRLREPKYLIGAVVALGYFGSLLFVRDVSGNPIGYFAHTFTVFLAFAHLRAWVPYPRQATGPNLFKLADVNLLFPTPVHRTALLVYAVLGKLPGALLFGTFFFFLSGFSPGALVGFAAFTLIMTLHTTVATFFRYSFVKRPARSLLLFAPGWLYALALVLGVVFVWRAPPTGAADSDAMFQFVESLIESPGLREISYPVRAPALLMTGPVLGWPLLVCLAQIVLYLVWLVRIDVHYEEWAVRRAESGRKGRGSDARKGRWSPFARGGTALGGFFWIRWLGRTRPRRLRMILIGAAVILVIGTLAPSFPEAWLRAVTVAIPYVLQIVIIVVLFWKRGSSLGALDAMELLKPLPIRGWKVLLGDVCGAAAAGMIPLLGLLGLGVALTPQSAYQPFPFGVRLGMAGGLAVLLFTFFCGFHAIMYIQALWFPGLARLRVGREGAVGHNMLVTLLRMLFIVGLFPLPCILGAIGYGLAAMYLPGTGPWLPVLVGMLVLWGEILALVVYAGWMFDRADFLLTPETPDG